MRTWEITVRFYNRNPTRPLHHALIALQALTIQAPSAEAAENYANEIRLALEDQANQEAIQ